MRKATIAQLMVVLLIIPLVGFVGCKGKEDKFKPQTLKSRDGKRVITFTTPMVLRWKYDDNPEIGGYYSAIDIDNLLIIVELDGVQRDMIYEMNSDGVKDEDGVMLYSERALSQLKKDGTDSRETYKKVVTVDIAKLVEISNSLLVKIPGGCFEMGNHFEDGEIDEKPVHKVCLDDYKMDNYEVRQTDYLAAMGRNTSKNKGCKECPVDRVTWFEAKAYCEKLGKRLPTEAEWEYAARSGGKNVKYATEKDELTKDYANFNSKSTEPADQYSPNSLGLYNMSGNVYEWVSDFYDRRYYETSPKKNPTGSDSGRLRVLRGGSWKRDPFFLRATARYSSSPYYAGPDIGVRCVKN